MFEFVANLQFQATGHGLVILARFELLGKVVLASCVGIGLVVGIAVFLTVTQLLHQPGRRIAQVQRHLQRTVLGSIAHGGLEAHVHRIALGRARQVDHRLGHGQLAFGAAQALLDIPGIEAQRQGTRIGIADILAGHAHHATCQVQRIAATIEHACVPVQGRVWVGAPHRFVQRGNLVVERLAALVETSATVAQQVLQKLHAQLAAVFSQVGSVLQQVEQAPAIAIGGGQQDLEALLGQLQLAFAQPFLLS